MVIIAKKETRKSTAYKAFAAIAPVVAIALLLLSGSCAQVVPPGGGPMDKTAPRPLKYSPDSAALLFSSREIRILFDEYIQLRDLSSQLIISPPLSKTPDISIQGKELRIVLDKEEKLKPNTTYSIHFGNALQDMNENNPYTDFRYIFSTGSYIDSLSIEGKLRNAFDQKTEKGLLVMLYSDMSDSAAFNGQPDYFARSNADGSFRINNIRKANYQLAAIKDLNANYRYDGPPENIAFFRDTVFPGLKQQLLLEMFKEEEKPVLKKYIHDQYGKITLVFSRGSDSLRVLPLNNDLKGVQEFRYFSRNKDTLVYWLKNFEKDSLLLQVSNGSEVLDTVEFKMIKREEALKSKRKPLKFSLVKSPDGNQNFDLGKPLTLSFSSPIGTHTDTLLLREDTLGWRKIYFLVAEGTEVTLAYLDSTMSYEDPDNPGTFITSPSPSTFRDWKENTRYSLLIPPGTFTDIFGLSNDSILVKFKTREKKFYGSLKLNLELYPAGGFVVQLLTENEAVLREERVRASQTLEYDNLYPQKYKLRIIEDANANGKWDPGNYTKRILPEKVIYNKELIMIRSNWDAELDWKAVPEDAAPKR